MDPNLFHLDWERTFEVLAAIAVLAIFVERALAVLFEHRWFINNFSQKGLKELIAFVVSLGVCVWWKFDAVSMIVLVDRTSFPGEVLTAGVIAGGSKGSVKLFRDILKLKSNEYAAYEAQRKGNQSPPI